MMCPTCGNHLQEAVVPMYQYKQGGLSNVYLKDSAIMHSCACGHKFVEIPSLGELHNAIGYHLLKKKSLLKGDEFRFLRKWVGLTAEKLITLLGFKSRVTVSKWENDKEPITAATDHAMRLLVLRLKEDTINKRIPLEIACEESFAHISKKQKEVRIELDPDSIQTIKNAFTQDKDDAKSELCGAGQ